MSNYYYDRIKDSGKKYRDFKIYALQSYNDNLKLARIQAEEALEFKIKLVDEKSGTTNEEINKTYTYWSPHINGGIPQVIYKENDEYWGDIWKTKYSWEIGMDMICDKFGMFTMFYEQKGDIFAIPLDQTELIKFFDENTPPFTKIIKRIHGK